jgi:phosphohistidine phosphatase SixA
VRPACRLRLRRTPPPLVRSSSAAFMRSRGCPAVYDCAMGPPGITRHRRPFLAPLWAGLLGVLVIGGIGWTFYRGATVTVVFLVRPVEKDPGTIEDAPLSPEGEARAQRLAQMFGGTGGGGRVDVVYESDERRAQQTAAPLVERLHRAPVVFRASDARAAVGRALREHPGGTVLVIAGAPALPQMIRELTGAQPPSAAPDEPELIYMVSVPSVGHAHLVRFGF